MAISVVIITKNEAHIIEQTLQSLQPVSDDIVIVDSGSTDDTINICRKYNAHIIQTSWDGYGINKNKGIKAAKNNWILSLDADEAVDETLRKSLQQLSLDDDNTVYNLKYKNFFCDKWIRFGEWSGDKHIRLFNRTKTSWSEVAVHETLLLPANARVTELEGHVLHYTVNNIDEYMEKTTRYARLNAFKYYQEGKRPAFFKLYISPFFRFIKHYIFELGFLDGKEGYLIARTTAWYTFIKYVYLRDLIRTKGKIN